ncbi:type II toxin-antitoxin system mRNA interferase toxin, RelE/StbE family [soil metagenome]
MLAPSFTGQFKKDRKRAGKRHWDVAHLDRVIRRLIDGKSLDAKYKAHTLRGNYDGYSECRSEPDFPLSWYYSGDTDIVFVRTGSHSDLFE